MFASLILLASLVSVVSAVGPHKTHQKLSSEEVSKFMDTHGERLIEAKIAQSSFSGMQAQIMKTHGKKPQNEKLVSMGVAPLKHRPDMKKQRRAHAYHSHKVVFAVKQKNLDRLEQILHEVSDPKSKKFGQHLTRAQVTKLTANPEAAKDVVEYLARNGASVVSQTRSSEYITAEAPVHVWESIFQTTFYEFEQDQNPGKKVVRAEEFFAPASLPELVTYVYNVVDFPDNVETSAKDLAKIVRTEGKKLRKAGQKHSVAGVVNGVFIDGDVTPAFINQLYDIRSNTGSQLASQAVYESLNQSYSPSDLTDFQNAFQLPVEAVSTVIGGHAYDNACVPNDGDDCGEANLDVQYLMGVSQNTPTTYYYDEDWMLGFIKSVADMANPPLVISISYGGSETSPDYTSSFDTEAMKLGVMGVTILASSGDDGVAGSIARGRPYLCGYSPSFPASSPYVTAVGGTFGPEEGKPEVACTSDLGGVITTGGGFSNRYPQPSWQTTQVSDYFKTVTGTSQAPAPGYNPTGRGYPDVSALAARYVIYSNGNPSPIWGTSASAPTVSAMVSLVNSARLDAGKSALGWINPSLYALQDQIVLNDITSGENNCVAVASVCCTQGFYATKGWDPVTGIGSLNFTAFKSAFVALGDSPNSPTQQPTPLPGDPTLAPVVSPTLAPSTQPSAQPTLSAGWLTYTVYGKTGCTDTSNNPAVLVTGVPSGHCFANYNLSNPAQVVGSQRYSCAGSVFANIEHYSDAACSSDAYVGTSSLYLGCTPSYQSNYDENVYLSSQLTCTAASVSVNSIPLPAGSTDSVYSTHLSYNSDTSASDSTCAAADLAGFSSFLNGVCFSDAYGDIQFSLKYDFPNVLEYRAAACQSQDYQLTRVQSETCGMTLSSDDDSILVMATAGDAGDVSADGDDAAYGSSSYYPSAPISTTRTYGLVQKSTVPAVSTNSNNGFFDKTTNVIAIAVTAGVVGLALVGVLAYWLIIRNSSSLKKPLLEGSQV